jgi:hypothetical protein
MQSHGRPWTHNRRLSVSSEGVVPHAAVPIAFPVGRIPARACPLPARTKRAGSGACRLPRLATRNMSKQRQRFSKQSRASCLPRWNVAGWQAGRRCWGILYLCRLIKSRCRCGSAARQSEPVARMRLSDRAVERLQGLRQIAVHRKLLRHRGGERQRCASPAAAAAAAAATVAVLVASVAHALRGPCEQQHASQL